MQQVSDLMKPNPVTLPEDASVFEAADAMRQHDIGAVLVQEASDGKLCGILTDRDIVVRCIGDGEVDPSATRVGEVCSQQLAAVSPDTTVEDAIEVMRARALRRIPVLEGDEIVGILSLGDLALARDPGSVLGQVSAAPASR